MPENETTAVTEQWRAVPGWEGRYEVSDLGRVRSLRRGNRWHGDGLRPEPRVRRKHVSPGGYAIVDLWHRERVEWWHISHLVLLAFVGPRPGPAPLWQAAHLNGDQTDNRPANLRWVTCTENNRHKIAHGTIARGAMLRVAKLDAERVRELRRLWVDGARVADLAARFGVSKGAIHGAVTRRTWAYVT